MIFKCVACVLGCFHFILRRFNKMAYIEIAIYGCSYCRAVTQAVRVSPKAMPLVFVVNFLGFVLSFLMKFTVTGLAGIGAYILYDQEAIGDDGVETEGVVL